jgi:programmed cell death protein 5
MNGDVVDAERLQQMQQLEQLKKQLLSKVLTKEAYERLGRVRTVNAALAGQAELYLIQVYQTGQLKDKVTDEKMKSILKLLQEKRETKIKRA